MRRAGRRSNEKTKAGADIEHGSLPSFPGKIVVVISDRRGLSYEPDATRRSGAAARG